MLYCKGDNISYMLWPTTRSKKQDPHFKDERMVLLRHTEKTNKPKQNKQQQQQQQQNHKTIKKPKPNTFLGEG